MLRFTTLSALLALALAPTACTTSSDDSDDLADEAGTETGEQAGQCVQISHLDPVIQVSVAEGDTPSTLSATCVLDSSSVEAGIWTLTLSCTDADAAAYELTLTAPAEATPVGLELGAELELSLQADDTNSLGAGPSLLLSDAEGPVLAQGIASIGSLSWGPISLAYASYCPAVDEFGLETLDGFVRTTLDGTSYDVLVGEPQVISDGTHSWDVHALYAYSVCCHGESIDAAIVRR